MNNGWSAHKTFCSFVLMSIFKRQKNIRTKNKRTTAWSAHKNFCSFVLMSIFKRQKNIRTKNNE